MRRALCLLLLLVLAFAPPAPAVAVQPDEILRDPALEARARALSRELRCMVCQNESIDESNAPLARDLRLLVRERLTAGDTDPQVIDFLVSRYGEFVLLRPRLTAQTAILWGAPILVLLLGAGILIIVFQRRRSSAPEEIAPLTVDEEARVSALIDRHESRASNITKS